MSEQLTPLDEQSLMEVLGAEQLEVIKCDDIVTANAVSFPLTDVSKLGKAFSGLSSVFAKLSKASNNSGELYRATFPVSGKMMKAKDGSGFYGAIVDKKNTIVGQTKFEKVTDVSQKNAGLSNIYTGLALMAINRSLETVAETQRAIIDFLETDKQTQLKGDLTVLAEIIKRDEQDTGRDYMPLRIAEDAVVIDTSDLTIDEVVGTIIHAVRGKEHF